MSPTLVGTSVTTMGQSADRGWKLSCVRKVGAGCRGRGQRAHLCQEQVHPRVGREREGVAERGQAGGSVRLRVVSIKTKLIASK